MAGISGVRRLAPALAALWVCLGACGGDSAETPTAETAPPARIENEALDLALGRVPPGLTLRSNGADLRLAPASAESTAVTGEIRIVADPPSDYGIDVVKIANDQQAAFLAEPRGEFFGAQKLVTPLGDATYARGRFDAQDGSRVEEARAFAVHPAANRLVTVTYQYPAGEDSRERVAALLEVLGEIEARTPIVPEAATPAAGS
jgi:hypothetical protein